MSQLLSLQTCALGDGEISPQQLVKHHTSYFPEVTISMHRSCHVILHKTSRRNLPEQFRRLLAPSSQLRRFYQGTYKRPYGAKFWQNPLRRIIEPCSKCGRVLEARNNGIMDHNMRQHQLGDKCVARAET